MDFLVALCAERDKIFRSIITQPASWLNVMDLKALKAPARLAAPAVSVQNLAAESAISFSIKSQAWPLGKDPSQSVTWIFSRSCLICGFGRPSTNRVNEGK